MHPFAPFRRLVIVLVGVVATGAASGATPVQLPGWQPDGSILLPNQWSLKPAGREVPLGDFPLNLAVHPTGHYAAVLQCGWGPHEVRIIDLRTQRTVSQVNLNETFYGISWSPDGSALFVSGAGAEVVHAFQFAEGYLSAHRELRLRPAGERGVPAGLTVSRDGKSVFTCEVWGQRVSRTAVADGAAVWQRTFTEAPKSRKTTHEENRAASGASSEAPFPYACVLDDVRGADSPMPSPIRAAFLKVRDEDGD